MSEPLVTYARDGHVAILTLNRPEAMNAMNVAMFVDLAAALKRFAADDEAWVGLMRGEGRAFCTGGDLKEALELIGDEPENFYTLPRQGLDAFAMIGTIAKPMVAAVHGYCMAGGLLLANACDLVVAGESTKFGMPETSVGMPTMGYLNLWKFMGPRVFMEKVLTAEPFGAAEAHACGLVNRLAPDDQVQAEALKLAQRIAANSPRSVAAHTQAIRLSVKYNREVLEEMQRRIWDPVVFGEDIQEGLTAFRERRKPQWKNR
jgi:enoyl-CoA hydratase/carnithine racemase